MAHTSRAPVRRAYVDPRGDAFDDDAATQAPVRRRHAAVRGAAVFVDPAGRRRRLLVGAGAAASVMLVVFLVAIAVALIGGNTSILPGLPSGGKHPASGHIATQPKAAERPTNSPGIPPAPAPTPSSVGSAAPSPSPSASAARTHPNNGRSPSSRPSHSHP
jgi:hypothetical protein